MTVTTSDAYRFWSERVSYDEETGIFRWLPRRGVTKHDKHFNTLFAGKIAGTSHRGYVALRPAGVDQLAHRVAWVFIYGDYPDGSLDHINGNRSDNRRCNLRLASPLENGRNRALNTRNKSGVSGVHFSKRDNRWYAMIYDRRKAIYLGSFMTLEEAAAARKRAEREIGFHPNHCAPWRPDYSAPQAAA